MSDELRVGDGATAMPARAAGAPERLPYSPPCSVQLSGAKDEEYGAAIAAVAVWVIGIGPAWIW